MAITDPSLLTFVAEGIRPAADKIIGGYESATLILQAWNDADDAGKGALWRQIKALSQMVWDAWIDADRISKPWEWSLSAMFPNDSTQITDGHSRPITSEHVNSVADTVAQFRDIFSANDEALAKAVLSVAGYSAMPSSGLDGGGETIPDLTAMSAVVSGAQAYVTYIDAHGRRARIRDVAVNPQLHRVQ